MEQAAVIAERLDELGELRIYRRAGPPEHVAIEILRDSDGRAWTLRVPWTRRASLRELLADAQLRLEEPDEELAFDEQGCAELGKTQLAPDDEVLAVILEQGEDHAFALWRRELTRQGWSWTLDVVIAPRALAGTLCARLLAGLEQLDQRPSLGPSTSAPSMPTSSQPPSASTRSTSRR
jgi:hypothetical protein